MTTLLMLATITCGVAAGEGASPYAKDDLTPIYQKAAAHVLAQVAPPKTGYCFVYGAGQGRLAYHLASGSDLKIIGAVESDNDLRAGRKRLHDADFYGQRITLLKGALGKLRHRDYAAVLVVSDDILANGKCTGSAREMFRMVRPDGGIAIVGQPAGSPNPLRRAELEQWLQDGGLAFKITEDRHGLWARVDRGPLPGAGEWTHMWADLGNTACSGDMRTRDGKAYGLAVANGSLYVSTDRGSIFCFAATPK